MKENENHLRPERLDSQTERGSDELSSEERRLIQHLYTNAQTYSQENQLSLERIWSRFVQKQQASVIPQAKQAREPEDIQLFIKGKAMQNNEIYQDTPFSPPNPRPGTQNRRPLWRAVSISIAAAVVLITILSWALLSSGLRNGIQHQTQTGTTTKTQAFSSGTLSCSIPDDNGSLPVSVQPSLSWSSNNQIAATFSNLKTFSAQHCEQVLSSTSPASYATLSPDGKRLLVQGQNAEILDASTGKVIATSSENLATTIIEQSVWSADGTQVISAVINRDRSNSTPKTVSVDIWNISTGTYKKTLISEKTFLEDALPLSPNGKYVTLLNAQNAIEVWNINTGEQVGTIPAGLSSVSALSLSPDGSSLALGLMQNKEVQIWSVASGKMQTSFQDSDDWAQVIGALSWSPDGKYLAESTSAIHIWNVATQKIAATFGKVDNSHWVPDLAWSPDSSMLASSTITVPSSDQPEQVNTVNVWKLS